MIQITDQPIPTAELLEAAQQPAAGAVVLFLGTTREFTGERQTRQLSYEAYLPLAERELEKLENVARERWPLVDCRLVHRIGEVPLAEASVAIVTSSPHRADAYQANRWLIDQLKETVPIWKRECYADGTTEWVHPVAEHAEEQP